MNPKQNFRGPSSIDMASFESNQLENVRGNAYQTRSGKATSFKKSAPAVQRMLSEPEDDKTVMRKEKGSGKAQVSAGFQSSVNASKGGGSNMDGNAQKELSGKFGADFGGVKIHNNSRSHQLASEINAKAFTIGQNIYFNKGEYEPNTKTGKKLLAHELTHTIQQKNGATNDVQPSLYRNEKIHSGSKKIGPGITMRWRGKKVSLTANMEIYGPKATAAVATAIQSDISGVWNRTFADGYEVKSKISVKARAKGAKAAANRTEILVDAMTGPSNVSRGWVVGSRYMSLDIKDLVWVPAHEFGHLLGLSDRYSESFASKVKGSFGYTRTTVVQAGWGGNIMAVHGGVLESKNVKNLLDNHAYRVVTIVEDATNAAAREINKYESALKKGWIPRF